jgi:OOP family OmpA-OmpF porin
MKKTLFAAVATTLLAASPAFAADDTGFYVGAGVGNFAANSDLIYNGKDWDGSDFGYKVFGGYQFMKWLAAEAEYVDGGEPDDNFNSPAFPDDRLKASVGITGFVGSAVGIWPIGESFNLFGKLGFIYWDADGSAKIRDAAGTIVKTSVGEDGTDFAWGVGGTWNFTETFGVRAEYQGFELSNFDSVDFASASIIWRF